MVVSCPQCGMDATEVTGNTLACNSCGTVVEESEIVSEVAFAENSFGGAVVQGNYVADDAGESPCPRWLYARMRGSLPTPFSLVPWAPS